MATAAQLTTAAHTAGFTGTALLVAVAIALAESGGNEKASHRNSNGSTDYGAWQINSVHSDLLSGKNPYDLQQNADMAYAVYKSSGFGAWTTYNSGAYKGHLTAAQSGATSSRFVGAKSVNNPGVLSSIGSAAADPLGTAASGATALGGVLSSIGSAAADPLGTAASGATALGLSNPISDVNSLISVVGQASFWRRIGIGVLAFVLFMVAVIIMIESNKTVRGATGDALKVAAVA